MIERWYNATIDSMERYGDSRNRESARELRSTLCQLMTLTKERIDWQTKAYMLIATIALQPCVFLLWLVNRKRRTTA